MGLLWFIIIGAIAGWLAGRFMKGHGFGLLGDIVVGIVGAFIGGSLFSAVGVNLGGGLVGTLVVAFIGAGILLFIVRLVAGCSGPRSTSSLCSRLLSSFFLLPESPDSDTAEVLI